MDQHKMSLDELDRSLEGNFNGPEVEIETPDLPGTTVKPVEVEKRKPGRPKGSLSKMKTVTVIEEEIDTEQVEEENPFHQIHFNYSSEKFFLLKMILSYEKKKLSAVISSFLDEYISEHADSLDKAIELLKKRI